MNRAYTVSAICGRTRYDVGSRPLHVESPIREPEVTFVDRVEFRHQAGPRVRRLHRHGLDTLILIFRPPFAWRGIC